MIGVELVEDSATRVPAAKLCEQLITQSYRNGLLLLSCGKSTIRFMPPLLITQAQIDEALSIVSGSLKEVMAAA
jgi:4-aminobutyrate aminotransferase